MSARPFGWLFRWLSPLLALAILVAVAPTVTTADPGGRLDDSVRRANRVGATVAGDSTGRGGGRGGRTLAQFHPDKTRVRVTAERDIPKGVSVLRGARIVAGPARTRKDRA